MTTGALLLGFRITHSASKSLSNPRCVHLPCRSATMDVWAENWMAGPQGLLSDAARLVIAKLGTLEETQFG